MSQASETPGLALYGGIPALPEAQRHPWPEVDGIDESYVLASLRQSNHAFGPNCQALEREWADWNGNRYCITTNSGTAALHMGVAACGCGVGDEVIVPAYSWSSSATCVLHHNAIPVFVDIDYATMNLDATKLEAAITPRTKAIIVVHLHGMAADMDPIMEIAWRHGLRVIEDACQAHGAHYKGRHVGTFGDCAAFSLNQNKNLCSGEGGLFVTDNADILERARMLWSFGEVRTPVESRDYHAYALGWMYRNNDLTAAFGRAQLSKLDRNLQVQQAHGDRLLELLNGIPGLVLPVKPANRNHTWYNFVVRLHEELEPDSAKRSQLRDRMVHALGAEGLNVMVWQQFILPAMTVFQAKNAYGRGCPWSCAGEITVDYRPENFPQAQRHVENHLALVSSLRHPHDDDTVDRIAEAFWKVMKHVDQLRS
jgi:dTDP-4-amino-4,6-dideoxygalactose transaminase